MFNTNNTINIGFKDCTFNNCNFNISNGGSSSNTSSSEALAGVAVLGGIYFALNPIALGTVLAIGTTVAKTACILGIGTSTLSIGGILGKSIVEDIKDMKLLSGNNQEQKYLNSENKKCLTTTYKVLEG